MALHGVSLNATPGSVGRMATGYGSCGGWLVSWDDGVAVGRGWDGDVVMGRGWDGGVAMGRGESTGLEWGTLDDERGGGDDAASVCSSTNCSRNSGGNVKGVDRSSLWSIGGGEMSS